MEVRRVRCNRCAAEFDEDDIKLVPRYNEAGEFYEFEEHCPWCGATDALMDMEE